MEVPFPQASRTSKSPLLLTAPLPSAVQVARRKTELPAFTADFATDPTLTQTEGSERPRLRLKAHNYVKRLSLDLRNVETPGTGRAAPTLSGRTSAQTCRKTPSRLKQEWEMLEGFGFKTAAAVPTEVDVFRERRRSNLCFSTMELWGPEHTRMAVRSMGYSDAFRAIEDRDKRLGLTLEAASTGKFNARIADDLTIMKVLNRPMVRSVSNFDSRTGSKTERLPSKCRHSKRLNKIFEIMDSCDQLTKESRALRKSFSPLEEVLMLRRKRMLRRVRN